MYNDVFTCTHVHVLYMYMCTCSINHLLIAVNIPGTMLTQASKLIPFNASLRKQQL